MGIETFYLSWGEYEAEANAEMVIRSSRTRINRPRRDNRGYAWILTDIRKSRLKVYKKLYRERFREDPCHNQNLVVFLGDAPPLHVSWSAVSGCIPTYRMNSAFFWYPAFERWLTWQEKLCSMGYPIYPELASAMRMPIVDVPSIGPRMQSRLGNGMHLTQATVALLVGLACVQAA